MNFKQAFTIVLFVFVFGLFTECKQTTGEKTENEIENLEHPEHPERTVDLKYFETEKGWGYDVFINGKRYIHQVHLPCECGGEGFATKEKAMKAAEFLKLKIENYDRSLQISRDQLDSLGAL